MDLELRKLFLDEAGTDEAEDGEDDLLPEGEGNGFDDEETADEEDGDEAV